MKIITYEMLETAGACLSDLERFDDHFPRGAPVTVAAFQKADKLKLDWAWTENLLTPSSRRGFDRFRAGSWRKCRKMENASRKNLGRVKIKYGKVIVSASIACEKQIENHPERAAAESVKLDKAIRFAERMIEKARREHRKAEDVEIGKIMKELVRRLRETD